MRRGLFLIYVTFTCLTMFVYCETVLAGSMNSKAGITFSNSYNPDITTDSIIPDGSKVVDNTSDDRMNKSYYQNRWAFILTSSICGSRNYVSSLGCFSSS